MLHNDTNIKTIITTSGTPGIDVFANYRDQNGVLRAFFEKITTATDTELEISKDTVVIDFLSIKNIHASSTNTVTLKKNNGTDTVELFKVVLSAGEVIQYEPQKGCTVFTADGKIKVQTATGGGGGASAWGDITGTLSDQTDLQSALDSKEDSITAGTTGQYLRGDKSWQTLDKNAVGLGNVVNSDTTTTANITDSTDKRFMTDAQETKLDSVESNADVTDATNVAAAGAFMKSVDDTDDITEGVTKKFMTTTEQNKLSFISITQNVDLDDIETRVNNLDAAVVLKGSWDASGGTFPGGGTAQAGASYIVSVAGTVDGVVFNINDRIIAVTDNASTTTYAANWFKADYTDQFLSLDGQTGTVTLGALINTLSSKTTPVDADEVAIRDSADSSASKRLSWSNIKATLKTYLDTLYQPINAALTSISGLSPSNDDIIQRKAGAWTNRTMSQLKTDLALVKGDVGLGNVDNTSDSTKNSATATLTNKRITKRVGTDTSSATPTINTDNVDVFKITAQAVDITSFTTNLSGTPSDFDSLTISITGTASRAITWGSSFENGAATLPTTTSGTNTLDVHFRWNSTTSKWRCMAQG